MRLLIFLAICAMMLATGCKNKGQTASIENAQDSQIAAVIDSILGENDTVPPPLYVVQQGDYFIVAYWEDITDERSLADTDPDANPMVLKSIELQLQFRNNPAQYTNLLIAGKSYKVKFVDEILDDPDGERINPGTIHVRDIPTSCARFALVDPKDKLPENAYSGIIVTDSYLESRKALPITYEEDYTKPLPADIVKQQEQRYGMKAMNSHHYCSIGDGCSFGYMMLRMGLAFDVLSDGKNTYFNELRGDSLFDGEGDYASANIACAFKGPKGLELCYTRIGAANIYVGMLYLVDGKLVDFCYAIYNSPEDEPIPLWKKDIAEMRRLYVAKDPGENKHVKFTKYADVYIDYESDWFWMRDGDDQNGAIFKRKNGKIDLLAVETPNMKPTKAEKDGTYYLKVSGSPGGPSMYTEIWAFKDGEQTEHFTMLEVYGDIEECSLNNRKLSPEEGMAYVEKLPEFEEINAYFKDIEE